MRRRARPALFGLVFSAASLTVSAASAHVTLERREAPANSYFKFVLAVPHGCGEQATNTLRVRIPAGIVGVKPMPKAGWMLETVTGAYEQSYEVGHGRTVSEGVTEIVWSGGELPNAFYDEFVFTARITDFPAGTALPIPVVQECGADAAARWIEVPEEGQDAADLPHPAPVLTILEAKP